MSRRSFSAEFKRQSVLLVLNEGIPVKSVAIKMEIHSNTLYRWIQEYEKYGERAFPGKGHSEFVKQNKIKQLEKENMKLKEEVEVLKKYRIFLKTAQK